MSATPGWGGRAISVEESLLRVKPAVVLVVVELTIQARVDCGEGETRVSAPPLRTTGSGFIADASGLVVTNAHVVQPAHAPDEGVLTALTRNAVETACPSHARAPAPRARARRAKTAIHVLLSDGARHGAEVAKYSAEQDLALLRIHAADLPVLPVGAAAKDVAPGARVHGIGFPAVESIDALLGRAVKVHAAVTPARVSGVERDAAGNAVLRIDVAPSHTGGGPVVDDSGALAGVLTGPTPKDPSATARRADAVIPGDTLRDFLKDTEVAIHSRSRFTSVWRSALAAFFAGEYGVAARRLELASALRPDEPDVQRLLAEARARRPTRSWPWIAAGAGAVGAFAIIGWAHRSRRRAPRG